MEIGLENISLLKYFLNGAALQVKRGKQKRRNFTTTLGISQGNALSLRFFILYLDEALREFDSIRIYRDPRQL